MAQESKKLRSGRAFGLYGSQLSGIHATTPTNTSTASPSVGQQPILASPSSQAYSHQLAPSTTEQTGPPHNHSPHTPQGAVNYSPYGPAGSYDAVDISNGHASESDTIDTPTRLPSRYPHANTPVTPSDRAANLGPSSGYGLNQSYKARMRAYLGMASPRRPALYQTPGPILASGVHDPPIFTPGAYHSSVSPAPTTAPLDHPTTPAASSQAPAPRRGDTTISAPAFSRFSAGRPSLAPTSPDGNVSAAPLCNPFGSPVPASVRCVDVRAPELFTFHTRPSQMENSTSRSRVLADARLPVQAAPAATRAAEFPCAMTLEDFSSSGEVSASDTDTSSLGSLASSSYSEPEPTPIVSTTASPRANIQSSFRHNTGPPRQPNPNSGSLGAVDPYANSLWHEMFDDIGGVGKVRPSKQGLGGVASASNTAYQEPHVAAAAAAAATATASFATSAAATATSAAAAAQEDAYGEDDEAMVEFKSYIADVFAQMMYVSGETTEASTETTGIIEEIVRQQVIEILRNCTELAARRGSRSITINDLIFQIRHDTPKVSRLRTFLSWKDVRKNVKDSDDKAGDADLAAAEDPVGGVVGGGGPVDDAAKKNKKAKVGLPWEPSSFFNQEVPEREDEEDEEEEEMNHITLQRLRKADERTKVMTKEEYVTWSEFRQASFTYRKGKRFREWAGFSAITDSKPSDDIVDILGFLTFEMVQTLTEEALKIKDHEDLLKERTGDNNNNSSKSSKKRKLTQGLFDPPSEGRTPVESRHIQEAFRRLQARPNKSRAMLNGTRLQQRTNLRLI